jgi:hypothetical protein
VFEKFFITDYRLTCFLCTKSIPGYLLRYKHHLRFHHAIFRSNYKLKYRCVEENCINCNKSYDFFYQLQRHVLSNHPDSLPLNVFVDTEQTIEESSLQQMPSSTSYETSSTSHPQPCSSADNKQNPEKTRLEVFELETILKYKADLTCTQTVVDSIVETVSDHSEILQQSLKEQLEEFLRAKQLDNDPTALQLLSKFSRPSTFTKLRSNHLQNKAVKKNFLFVEPREIPLGARTDTVSSGRKRRKVESFQYISIIETLQALMSIEEHRDILTNETVCACDSRFKSFRDGNKYQSSPYFAKYPNSLRITLYYDDVEITNPLGSRTGIHKLGCFYFTIQNMPPYLKTKLDNIFVLAFCYAEDMKKYGVNAILRAFVDEMKLLESDEGVRATFDENFVLRAVLTSVAADSLAAHELLGFMSCSANFFCRQCLLTREELHQSPMHPAPLRTETQHQKALEKKTENCAVLFDSVLNELRLFHSTTNYVFDVMHDFLEGICKFTLKFVLHHYIFVKKSIIVAELNRRIHNFHYGPANSKDRPSSNFLQKSIKDLNDSCVKQKAVQVWLLMRSLPFLLHDIVKTEIEDGVTHIHLIVLLNKVFAMFTNTCQTEGLLQYAHCLYGQYLRLLTKLQPNVRFINKLHHITHYFLCTRESGPLNDFSCLHFEGFHKRAKAVTKLCHNFKNIPKSVARKMQMMNALHYHRSKKSGVLYHDKQINRKLRVATKIGSTFFWCLTSYRAAEIVQNDYLSSA